ncbi:hypothetical protein [Streptomyces bluensis]|uniref:hypothetical protein n=1 Tax=Streptomyces bluensis TaxID=33897 RepID=UPI00198B6161|nr:hypothetical protein [Streptomyces bluensis]GGZ80753.1 hypothetical protein GCM10010344_54740 [Streptomyces bluensis]
MTNRRPASAPAPSAPAASVSVSASWRRLSPAAFWRRRLSPYRTRRLLRAHLLVLAVCAAVAVSALLVSCRQILDGTEAVASREAPAVQGLAAARLAVLRAYQEADDLDDREAHDLDDLTLVGVAGLGETYRAQLSAADQGLSRIADRTDQDLGTVNGLLASYSNSINLGTAMYRDQPLMRQQKLTEARSLLTRQGVGLVPRLDGLQRAQLRHASATATMGWLQRGGWWIGELALAALALTLLSALFVLRDRCGRDWNPYLLAAFALTVLLAVVPLLTMFSAQDGLDSVVGDLRQITEVSRQDCCGAGLDTAQQTVTDTSEHLRLELSGDTWTERVYQGTLTGGLLVVVLPVVGLGLRLDSDYGRRP